MTIRTRFAPSPTCLLHIGSARTALYAWAFARRNKGTFVLRIEDTDLERSTPESVQAIFDGMKWLGLDYDEGPFYQMQRMPRYREVVSQMVAAGQAYPCYLSPEALERLREAQRARGEKPRYDGRWRPEPGKVLPTPPAGVTPVIRFKNPLTGEVVWEDMVKGRISISNSELDDLVIARPDGTPTYNFCVCVDDWDMRITHVLRGDDHVNNTPRQINILQALGAPLPLYGHQSTILNANGEKLSKRHGGVSVQHYEAEGYLPEAMLNAVARLGWGHGDEEIFSLAQFVEWFDIRDINSAPAQFDPQNPEKLKWLNNHYMKVADLSRLATVLTPRILSRGGVIDAAAPALTEVAELLRDRASTLNELADAAMLFYRPATPSAQQLTEQLNDINRPVLRALRDTLASVTWSREAVNEAIKAQVKAANLKMPQLAVPLRVMLTGMTQTPAIDAVVTLFGRERVLAALDTYTA
jgi:glutamyl-tRNA synthetase